MVNKTCESEQLLNFILKGCFATLLVIIGITGNLASFIIFSSGRHKNTVLIFLRSLAIADSLYLMGYFLSFSWYQFFHFYGKELPALILDTDYMYMILEVISRRRAGPSQIKSF